METLDLSAYDDAVIEHVLMGAARSRMFDDLSDGRGWDADLSTGVLAIGAARYHCEVLGTFSEVSSTFLWAWDHPGKPGWGGSLALATKLHDELAGEPGYATFREREIANDWVNMRELAYVAGELGGGHPMFFGGYDRGALVLAVTDTTISVAALPTPYLPGVLLDLASYSPTDAREATSRFLARLGFELASPPDTLVATRPDCSLRLRFADGKVRGVDLRS